MTFTASKLILLVGVITIILAAFGVHPQLLADVDVFQVGVGLCFASFLV